MTTSTVARGCFSNVLFSIFALIFAVAASAQSVASTNETLPAQETESALIIRFDDSPLFEKKSYSVVPLTVAAGRGQNAVAISAYNIQGPMKVVDRVGDNIARTDVVFIGCDPTDTSLNASLVVADVAESKPQAVVLYSNRQEACSHSGDFGYQSMYSMTSNKESKDFLSTVAVYSSSLAEIPRVIICSSSTNIHDTPVLDTNNEGGPAPTTAVAMSILYSITGVITLLFLIIIATGAIRAHRHPERYGPRNSSITGRQRQSRAKGLARAMLETLPIVKFGVSPPMKGKTELDYGEQPSHTHLEEFGKKELVAEEGKADIGPIITNAMGNDQSRHEGDLGCTICTEDFMTGEDLRVLPCNHKYHPACVDPWLLNVCGTCPLCRLDLRPSDAEIASQGQENPPPPLSAIEGSGYSVEDEVSYSHRHRITRFFDLHRLRTAPPDESIAVLRQLRQQLPADASTTDLEERSRRARLTDKLKEVFRVKTRTQSRLPSHSS